MEAYQKEKEELTGICAQRAAMYRLLAALADREVSAKTYKALETLAETPLDPAADECEQRCIGGLRIMGAALKDYDEDLENLLACDFARVFLASGRYEGHAAVPYESIYTSEEQILMQEARDEVRAIYRESGVMPCDEGVPEDYLPFELEYMALLNDRFIEALENADDEQVDMFAREQFDFLNDHLLNWVDDLIEDIDRMAETSFYHAYGQALGGFLRCEEHDTAELVDVCSLDKAC